MKFTKELSDLTCQTSISVIPVCAEDGKPIALLVGKYLSCIDCIGEVSIYPIIYSYDGESYIIPDNIKVCLDMQKSSNKPIDIKSIIHDIYNNMELSDVTIQDNSPNRSYKINIENCVIHLHYSVNVLEVSCFKQLIGVKKVFPIFPSAVYIIDTYNSIIAVDIFDISSGRYYYDDAFYLEELKIDIDCTNA